MSSIFVPRTDERSGSRETSGNPFPRSHFEMVRSERLPVCQFFLCESLLFAQPRNQRAHLAAVHTIASRTAFMLAGSFPARNKRSVEWLPVSGRTPFSNEKRFSGISPENLLSQDAGSSILHGNESKDRLIKQEQVEGDDQDGDQPGRHGRDLFVHEPAHELLVAREQNERNEGERDAE